MVKAVIFDVEGTLVDSVDLHAQAWVDAFKEIGRDIEFDAVRSQIGKGGDQLMPVFLSKEELDEKGESLNERRGEILKERYLGKIKPFPDVRALFERTRADGTRIVLASSAKADELETYKKIADIEGLTDAEQAGGRVATVSIEAMRFLRPVSVGDEVSCYCTLGEVGETSIPVRIETWARERGSRRAEKVTEGLFTYVALDEDGRPRRVRTEEVDRAH